MSHRSVIYPCRFSKGMSSKKKKGRNPRHRELQGMRGKKSSWGGSHSCRSNKWVAEKSGKKAGKKKTTSKIPTLSGEVSNTSTSRKEGDALGRRQNERSKSLPEKNTIGIDHGRIC